jgi:hypothetical protein
MSIKEQESFYYWINERHSIYKKRLQGQRPPWTNDPILQEYKFTNPFRENDRVTIWMRKNWTVPNNSRPASEIIFNCCLFRMIGTSEFANQHKWVKKWDPYYTRHVIQGRLNSRLRTFTGAYIITNQGIKAPKANIVVDNFLTPIWENRKELANVAQRFNSLQIFHECLSINSGWGGGGFMSYEVVTDLNYTKVLRSAKDKMTWANAGPGAVRGLNRIHNRPTKKSLKQEKANLEMKELLSLAPDYRHILNKTPLSDLDMRTIEHSLCEWDKYQRILNKEGRSRSKFDHHVSFLNPLSEGVVF